MYDFDKLFSDYILKKGHVCEDEFNEVYEEWLDLPLDFSGATPRQIADKMSDDELVSELKEECLCGSPSFIVMETIEKRGIAEKLVPLLDDEDETLKFCAAELLCNMNKAPLNKFVALLPSAEDEELFELLVSALKDDPDAVKDELFELASDADERLKTVIAEILVEGKRDERTFKLLCELFACGDNIPLYCDYIARYGDERAAAMLYRALDTARYADYIEIRNAIESLGGIVDEDRDFSSDPDYILLKEKKGAN